MEGPGRTHAFQRVGEKPYRGSGPAPQEAFQGPMMRGTQEQGLPLERKKHSISEASLDLGCSVLHTWEYCSDRVQEETESCRLGVGPRRSFAEPQPGGCIIGGKGAVSKRLWQITIGESQQIPLCPWRASLSQFYLEKTPLVRRWVLGETEPLTMGHKVALRPQMAVMSWIPATLPPGQGWVGPQRSILRWK